MKKLPVAETVRYAYQFAFGQLGTIIGLIWAPMVAVAVLKFLPYGLGDANVSPQDNPAAAGGVMLRGLLFTLVSFLLYGCINVAVIRQALGLRTGPAIFHFSIGRPEFRLAAATLLLTVISIAMVLAFGLISVVVGTAAAASGRPQVGDAVAVSVMLAGLCLFLVVLVRLSFLYVPSSVVENKMGLVRSWVLTEGNFWRASAVLFLVTLPAAVILFSSFFWLMGRDFTTLIPVATHLAPEALSARIDAIVERHIGTIIGINLIVAPFSIGLMLGAAAYGYRFLTGAPAPVQKPA